MSGKYQPAAEFIIEDVETLKVPSDPRRLRILELFGREPRTVKQVAAMMQTPASKLYYHVNLMEQHGLLRVIETRVVSGIIEKHYQATAVRYRPRAGLLTADPTGAEMEAAFLGVFDRTRDAFNRSVRKGKVRISADAAEHEKPQFGAGALALTPEQVALFQQRLDDLMTEMTAEGENVSTQGKRAYWFMLTLFPSDDEVLKEAEDDRES